MTTAIAREWINARCASATNDALKQQYVKIKDLYEKKLWHPLTLKLHELVKFPQLDSPDELVQLYHNFIRDFETKINQLEFVKIILTIIRRQITAGADAFKFLQQISEKLHPDKEKEALALCLAELAWFQLNMKSFDECKKLIEKSQQILDTITGADPAVYSSYYRVLSLYYKLQIAPTEFYRNSLLYLVYTPLETMQLADQQSLAFDIGLAALVSPDIYNFGDLLAHPIVKTLEQTQYAWLAKFLYAVNSGDLAQYEQLQIQYKADFENQAILVKNRDKLREKISILALMELVFNKAAEERTLPFQAIATATKKSTDEVELLVMKALSLKLVKGHIDEVNQTVTITWVQPRILDINQVRKMKDRVSTWTGNVRKILTFMEDTTAPELLA